MINVLDFDMDVNYKFAWNIAARSIYHLNDNLEECMILYKYKLSDDIWSKFGTADPDKIDFEKLLGKSLIIFHSNTFKEKTDRFEELIIFCIERKIDVYIPLSRYTQTHIVKMREIIDKFENQYWDFTQMKYDHSYEVPGIISGRLKPLIRQIKLGKLF